MPDDQVLSPAFALNQQILPVGVTVKLVPDDKKLFALQHLRKPDTIEWE